MTKTILLAYARGWHDASMLKQFDEKGLTEIKFAEVFAGMKRH